MPDINPAAFISYSRDDQEFALRLAQDLKAAGAAIWLDQLDIEPGEPWDNAVEDALIASPRMVLVLSPHSSRSPNVRNEISFALEQGKIVIPVLYRDCIVPLQLQRNNRIDFRADYARGLAQLLAHLNVAHPNKAVLDKAAEGDARREAAWHAREAEAVRLRDTEEQARQAENARIAQQESLQREQEAETRRRDAIEQQRKAEADRQAAEAEALAEAEAQRRAEIEQRKKAEADRIAAEAEALKRRELEQQKAAQEAQRAAEARPVPALPPVPPPAPAPPAAPSKAAASPAPPQRLPAVNWAPPANTRPAPRTRTFKLWPWLAGGAAIFIILIIVVIANSGSSTPHPEQPATPDKPAAAPLLDPNSPAGQTAKAQADQGSNLLKSKNYAAALPVLTQACDAGNPDGCDSLGFMYQEKLGVAQDYSKALTLYSRSCNSGEANGCDLVARLDHEILFDFDGALKANQQVVKISPTAGHTMDLMEAELTDAHFDDCIQLAATLNPPSLDAAHVLVRDTIKLACQFGAGQAADAAETSRLISSQARAAKRDTWDFTGTLHFVQTSPPFETVQSAWIALFTAVQKGDAAGIRNSLAALQPTLQ